MNVFYDNLNYYAYIGIDENEQQYYTIIIDTNVAIDLERFFYYPHKIDSILKASIVELLINSINVNIVPGLAEHEACCDIKNLSVNKERFFRMDYALNTLFSWNATQISQHAKLDSPINVNYISNGPIITGESNVLIYSTYAAVLKLHLLHQKRKKQKGNELALFNEFYNFLNTEIRMITGLELNLAHDYFFGNSEQSKYVFKLVKFDSNDILSVAWNASWDISFLRQLQYSHFHGTNLGVIKPRLVTRDNALITLSKDCYIVGFDKNGIPILSFIKDPALMKHFYDSIEFFHKQKKSVANRESLNFEEHIELLKVIIKKLETELSL